MEALTLHANAKLNLRMEILSRREDGYHNICSVMQFVSLADVVELTPGEAFRFWCDDPALCNDDNLAVRAYRRLEQEYPVRPVSIRLHKKVPYLSGLGGGSADCAAVLRGINHLSELGLSTQQLCQVGRELGADVPACVVGGVMLAEDIGDRLTQLTQRKPLYFNVIMPKVAFSTQRMYAQMDASGSFAPQQMGEDFLKAVRDAAPVAVAAGLYNSFEAVAEPAEAIVEAKRLLQLSGAAGALMSGAGSAVFGVYLNQEAAKKAFQYLKTTGAQVYTCHSTPAYGDIKIK